MKRLISFRKLKISSGLEFLKRFLNKKKKKRSVFKHTNQADENRMCEWLLRKTEHGWINPSSIVSAFDQISNRT